MQVESLTLGTALQKSSGQFQKQVHINHQTAPTGPEEIQKLISKPDSFVVTDWLLNGT